MINVSSFKIRLKDVDIIYSFQYNFVLEIEEYTEIMVAEDDCLIENVILDDN